MATTKLIPHKVNASIYGDALDLTDPEHVRFLETVKARGLVQAIVVAADGQTIVSGHRRYEAAVLAGLSKVPIDVRLDLIDTLDIEEALLDANEQRVKNNASKGREFTKRKSIAAERTKRAKKRGDKTASETLEERAADADTAAKASGFSSRHTANKAEAIMKAVDDLNKRGKKKEADAIMADMTDTSKSVGHVYAKHIKAKASPPKKKEKAKKTLATGGQRTLTVSEELQVKKSVEAFNKFVKQMPPFLAKEAKAYTKLLREILEKY